MEIEMNGGDNMSRLTQYVIALTNLYGIAHKIKIVGIYNSQNEDWINLNEVEGLLIDPTEELEGAFIYPYKDYFVHMKFLRNLRSQI